ncbi:MAG TPA: hypothetical protein VFA18_18315 [Gemmataceae bacterium]|nr:hypothetical protein [Gemmataceae bacterium]
MQPSRPRVRYTSEVAGQLRREVDNRRRRIVQAVTAILEDLPREAAGFLDAQPPAGCPSTCFLWSKVFLDGQTLWRLDCIVSKAGWPDRLWVVDLFAREISE